MTLASDAFWNNLPATITAIAAVIAAVSGLFAAFNSWRAKKKGAEIQSDLKDNTAKTDAGNKTLSKVEKMVNGQQTAMKEEVAGLRTAMTEHGIECPPQSHSVKP